MKSINHRKGCNEKHKSSEVRLIATKGKESLRALYAYQIDTISTNIDKVPDYQ